MDTTRRLTLIACTHTQNESGLHIPADTRRDIFCRLTSVSAAEFFSAGREGMRPAWRALVFAPDYHGERIAELDGRRYSIYRTWHGCGEQVELYLEEKAGI